jgi:hypothetical protein
MQAGNFLNKPIIKRLSRNPRVLFCVFLWSAAFILISLDAWKLVNGRNKLVAYNDTTSFVKRNGAKREE